MNKFDDYHLLRGNKIEFFDDVEYFYKGVLPSNKNARILDIGCGFGSWLYAMKMIGYENVEGIDMDPDAVSYVNEQHITCHYESVLDFCPSLKYDFVNISHVLEHLDKSEVITIVKHIKENIMSNDSILFVRVPNAQSNVGAYWAYEDFTHNTIFTAGSLMYVLKAAGFEQVDLIDVDGIDPASRFKHIKKILQKCYSFRINFWNKVTGAAFHAASPRVFTWEIKAICEKK